MSGDRLDDMRERSSWVLDVCDPYTALYPAETAGALARDVLAMVEIAKQARAELRRQGCLCLYSRCPIHGESTGALAAALARLDSGAAEEGT